MFSEKEWKQKLDHWAKQCFRPEIEISRLHRINFPTLFLKPLNFPRKLNSPSSFYSNLHIACLWDSNFLKYVRVRNLNVSWNPVVTYKIILRTSLIYMELKWFWESLSFMWNFKWLLQCSCSGWPTGNGKNLSNSQACFLAQLCLAAA